jgi:predicted nucleic acid-binding protein
VKIFLDACAIIYWVEMSGPHYTRFADLLHDLRKKYKRPSFAVSHLSLLECRVKPLQERDENLLNRYQQFFCARDLTRVPISLDIIEKAAELRAFHHLRTPDALQASSAISIPDDIIFVTGDKNFKKIPKLEVLLIH